MLEMQRCGDKEESTHGCIEADIVATQGKREFGATRKDVLTQDRMVVRRLEEALPNVSYFTRNVIIIVTPEVRVGVEQNDIERDKARNLRFVASSGCKPLIQRECFRSMRLSRRKHEARSIDVLGESARLCTGNPHCIYSNLVYACYEKGSCKPQEPEG